jgi:branched-chain amino acid transport system substrate-binding protein
VAAVPGGVTDGLYAASGWVDLQARREDEAPAKFIAEYEAAFGQPATGFAMLGYNAAETVVRALEAAGPDLTQESFKAAMEGLEYYSDLLDTQIKYSPDNHQGANDITISVVENGLWKLVGRE